MIQHIINHYEEVYSKVNHNLAFEFSPTPLQKKQLQNFIDFLDKKIGMESLDEDFIFLFICFQFYRKKDQKTRFGVGRVPLNHIVGKKAYETWERKPDNWGYWIDKFILEYRIKRPEKEEKQVNKHHPINPSEENIKAGVFNTKEALFICSEFTTLFHPESEYCQKCKFQESCKELQKETYPNIYETRKGIM